MFRVSAIIPGAGVGSRFGEKKQFKNLNGEPLWVHTLKPFIISNLVDEVVFVVEESLVNVIKNSDFFKQFVKIKEIKITNGGASRMDSVLNGIRLSKKINNIVSIHDVARPFVKKSLINKNYLPCPRCTSGKLYLKKPKRINGYAWSCSLEPYCIGKAKYCKNCNKYPAVSNNRCIDPECKSS